MPPNDDCCRVDDRAARDGVVPQSAPWLPIELDLAQGINHGSLGH